ncbi:arylsulfatase [Boudabousia liubingyangii]|uniref:Arylsulfatase n=1 Tax=Boudabousia liubingyangii TaxID=1921764 RepID=A0A1Q5PPW7_9ACTO|nr:arylsulfatase [Boudabousia liubingyangii]OKL49563.1 arylsulfatase [Boudabousia liubingyangii]
MRNIVLICADQWRGDALGVHGNEDVHTPFIDHLGASGVDCTEAYAANPTCVPARVSMITGLSAQNHRRIGYQDKIPFDFKTTLPSVLTQAGYQTQAVGKLHFWPERNRAGFENVILHDGYLHASRDRSRDVRFYDDYLAWLRKEDHATSDYIDSGMECNSFVARPWDKSERLHPTSWVTEESIEWLYRRDPDRPFFLYVSYHRPHPPYDPPQWAWEIFRDADLADFAECDWYADFEQWYQEHDPAALVTDPGPEMRRRAMAGYYASMAHIDAQISRLRQALFEFGVLDDTLLVFTSDHGEMLGQYGLWRKGYPYEGSAKVPLILHAKDLAARQENRIVEMRDIMPTILEWAGVECPPEVEGRSFLQPGEPEEWREALHGEHQLFGQSIQWIRWGQWKYIWMSESGTEQLFDLAQDPEETHNLLLELPEARVQELLEQGRGYLRKYLQGRTEGFVGEDDTLVPGRPTSCVLAESIPLPSELR